MGHEIEPAEMVRDIIAEWIDRTPEEVTEAARLVEDLGMEDVELAAVLDELEEVYEIALGDDLIDQFYGVTVKNLIDLVVSQIAVTA